MRRVVLRVLALIAVPACWLALSAPRAGAEPVIDLSWDACSPLVSAKSAVPGQATSMLYCSIAGMDQPHTGYMVNLWFAGEMPCRTATSTPDAWRFDVAGCQGPAFGVIRTASTSKTCPALAGSLPTIEIREMQYSANDSRTPDPAVRYQMFKIDFDHPYAVNGPGTPGETCGGFETPMCFSLWYGAETVMGQCMGFFAKTASSYFDAQGSERFLQFGHGYASFGLGPGQFGCFEVTPARSTTWGAIKSQYH